MSLRDDSLLSYAEAGALVGRDTRTIRRWVMQRKIHAVGFGRSRWIRESDLLRALGLSEEAPSTPDGTSENNDF